MADDVWCLAPQYRPSDEVKLCAEDSSRAELFHKQSGTDERTESYSIFLRCFLCRLAILIKLKPRSFGSQCFSMFQKDPYSKLLLFSKLSWMTIEVIYTQAISR